MTFKSEELSWLIQEKIAHYQEDLALQSIGYVLYVGDGIARVFGLDDVMMSEIVAFPNSTYGIVFNLEIDHVGVILLGSDSTIKERDLVKRTGQLASIPVGEGLLGRVIDPLGHPLDGKGAIYTKERAPLERKAPNVIDRQPVHEPVLTGIKAIDSMIPIGRGQRELIIGDRQTGKTTLLMDTIINQRDKDTYCIYVAIGQKESTVAQIVKTLEENGSLEYTIVIVASASAPAPLQYIAPYAGAALGEYFMYSKRHAICCYDDLSKHAQAYRQLSLLLRRPPGREAYPGDIFYLHARLLERAAKLNGENGAGSLTALPVVETQANDISAYIPTNIISITDGQIYLESSLFYAGVRPAINAGISASRVGGKAQTKAMKTVAANLRLDLAQFRELAAFTQFGSELDEATQTQLIRGERMVEILKQKNHAPLSLEKEIVIIFAGTEGLLDDIPLPKIHSFEKRLYQFMEDEYPDILYTIALTKELEQATSEKLREAITTCKKQWQQ